jgi:serine/threonine protein kinase
MSVRHVAKTSARLGKWHIQDESGAKVGGSVRHWHDLRWDPAAGHRRIVQEEIGEQLAPIITLAQELGAGSFGRVFACNIRMPNQAVERHVIKLPRKLFQAGVLSVDANTRELITGPDHQNLTPQLRADFQHEFENFVKIYEGQNYFENFGSGRRGQVESADHWEGLQREMARLNMHEGRKHIHEYLHFDAAIPAIVSSFCFNTLENVRRENPGWFGVDIADNGVTVRTTFTFMRVARELALAVDYIHSRGYVHTDIKPANILVVLESGDRATAANFTCKLSDFGEIMENKPTTVMTTGYTPFYTPPEWPERAPVLEPSTFAIYGVAATIAALLHFPRYAQTITQWPLFIGTHFKDDMQRLRTYGVPGIERLGRLLFPAISDDLYRKGIYKRANAQWEPIAKILQLDYRLECGRKRNELLRNVISSTHTVAKALTLKRLASVGPPETLFPNFSATAPAFDAPPQDDEVDTYARRISDSIAMPPPFARRARPRPTPPGEYVAPPPIPPDYMPNEGFY